MYQAELLGFVRLIGALSDLDVLPIDSPDAVPELATDKPLSMHAVSDGGAAGLGVLALSPEIRAAALVVPGSRWSTWLFQDADGLYTLYTDYFPDLERTEVYVLMAELQMAFDPQDPLNLAPFVYREPLLIGESARRASVLLQEGLNDIYYPPYVTQAAAWALGIPHLEPVQSPVPFLDVVDSPVVANIDAETTAAFYQYVPVGVEGIAPTPSCAAIDEHDGHFCAAFAEEAVRQLMVLFRSAVEEAVPRIIDPLAE